MKVLKLLFNRIVVLAFAILVQMALFFAVLFFFNYYFVVFQIFSALLGIAVFLYVINKKECPEFKIPWLIILMLVPFFGVIIFIMFYHPRVRKKEIKLISEIVKRTEKNDCSAVGGAQRRWLSDKWAGIEQYIAATTGLHGQFNNAVTYYSVGEDFFCALKEELLRAKKFIFMEYFIISHGKMWDELHAILRQKVAEGVEVRLIYDDLGSLGKVEGSYYKKLTDEGIKCLKFNTLKPIVSGIYNNRDHRKITVIDGIVGFTGGINIGDEYINAVAPFGHWKDTAVKIVGPAVRNLTTMFFQIYDVTAGKTSDYDEYLAQDYPKTEQEGCVCVLGDGPKPYYNEQVGENVLMNVIYSAKKYVYITTPYLIIDYNMATALRNAAMRGVDVRIITPHIPDKKIVFNMTRSNYSFLMEAGVKIYEYTPGFIHAKMLVCDDEVAFVGTINLDYRSLVHHYECGAVMIGSPCIEQIKADVIKTQDLSLLIDKNNFKMNKAAMLINNILGVFSPMI